MCTNFDVSALTVLRKFLNGPSTEDDLYRAFADDVFRLVLGGLTLGQFLESLADDGLLSRHGDSYELTERGRSEVRHLEKVVGSKEPCESA